MWGTPTKQQGCQFSGFCLNSGFLLVQFYAFLFIFSPFLAVLVQIYALFQVRFSHQFQAFVLPALAEKTHRDHLSPVVVCCRLLWNSVNIWLYLPHHQWHALVDFNQSWVIYATWEPSFVDEVKGHISRSKVFWGQVVSLAENVKLASFEKLKSDLNHYYVLRIFHVYKCTVNKNTNKSAYWYPSQKSSIPDFAKPGIVAEICPSGFVHSSYLPTDWLTLVGLIHYLK